MHKLIFLLVCIAHLSFSQGNDNLIASAKDNVTASAKATIENSQRFSFYSLAAENLNRVADDLLVKNKIDWAISVYKLSLEETLLSSTYTKLGKAYLLKGNSAFAGACFGNALKLQPDNKEAAAELKKMNPAGANNGKGC